MDFPKGAEAPAEKLTNALLQALQSSAGDHKYASFHVDLHFADDKEDPRAPLRGGNLVSEDPTATAPFDPSMTPILDAFRKLSAKCISGKIPIYLLHYEFARRGATWDYRLTKQSLAEWNGLRSDRRRLDARLEEGMRAAADAGWERLSIERSDIEPVDPLRLVGFYPKLRELKLTDGLKSVADDYWRFFAERGLVLFTLAGEMEAKAKPAGLDIDTYFGGPKVESK
jgi:hypothetical protein